MTTKSPRRSRAQISALRAAYEIVPFNAQDHDFAIDPVTQDLMRNEVLRKRWGSLVQRIADGVYVSGLQIANALDEEPGAPVPPLIARYLAALLRQEITRKVGRKGTSDLDTAILGIADHDYRWYLHHISRMRARGNSILGAKWVREAHWFRKTPSDLAIMMVKHKRYPKLREETVKSMLSRYRRGRRKLQK